MGKSSGIEHWRAQARFSGPSEIHAGKNPRDSHPERLLHGSRLHCQRSVASSLDSKWRDIPERRHSGGSYLSAEFLMGPQLANNLINLGIYEEVREAFESAGGDWKALLDHEPEPGLGNGGLGRLAACFLDSLATLEIPCHRIRDTLRIRDLPPEHSKTASRSRPPTSGCIWEIPGKAIDRRLPTT